MANVLPKPVVARIQWCENHISPFTVNATAIGIDSTIAANFTTRTENARAALTARDAAEDALRDRNNDLRLAMIALSDSASGIINTVHAKANMVGNSVYSLASIPAPATPSPRPAPGEPYAFKVKLNVDGSLQFTWKCNNPAGSNGTVYQVFRRIAPSNDFIYLGGVGMKKFIDASIPAGSSQVTYQLQGVRSTAVGPWAQFNVNFGTNSGGAMTATLEESAKIAA